MPRGLENYIPVKQRIHEMRQDHPEWSVQTFVNMLDGYYEARCTITAGETVIASAGAYEKATKPFDYEKAETSAVGRALVFAGYTDSLELSREEQERAGAVSSDTTPTVETFTEAPQRAVTPIRRETTPPEYQIDGETEPPPRPRGPVAAPRSATQIAKALPVQSAPKALWRNYVIELVAATADEGIDIDWKLLAAGKHFDECTIDALKDISKRAAKIVLTEGGSE